MGVWQRGKSHIVPWGVGRRHSFVESLSRVAIYQRKNVLAYLRLHLFKCLGAVDDAEPFRFPGGDLIVAFLDAEEELPLGSFKAIELERECSIAPPAALFADLHGNPEQEG